MAGTNGPVLLVKAHLRALIERAELLEGAALDPLELAQAAGAPEKTIREALTELAREGFVSRKGRGGAFAVKGLPEGRDAGLPKVHSVAVVCAYTEEQFGLSTYVSLLLKGIRNELATPKTIQQYLHTGSSPKRISDMPALHVSKVRRECQGVLAMETYSAEGLNALVAQGFAVAAIDFAHRSAKFDSLNVDHLEAGYLATSQLIELGHRRIAYIGERADRKSEDPTWQDRLTGYLRAMAEVGSVHPEGWILGTGRSADQIPELLPTFHKTYRPTAYVLASGILADAALSALESLGVKCPKYVSLVSADGIQTNFGRLTLSRVKVDYEELGRRAVQLLAARLSCRALPPVRVNVPGVLVTGDSSKVCGA